MTIPNPRSSSRAFNPNMMSDVDHVWQYGAYFQLNNFGYAFRRHIASGDYQLFALNTLPGNPLAMPIVDPDDGHYALTVGIGSDDVLHVSGNDHAHTNSMRYVRCVDVNNFTDPASWEYGGSPFRGYASNGGGYIYALLDRMSDGTLVWFQTVTEGIVDGGKGRQWIGAKWVGRQWVGLRNGDAMFAKSYNKSGTLLGGGNQTNSDGSAIRVYMTGFTVERRPAGDRMHVTGLWRLINAPDPQAAESSTNPWYLYSDDAGVTWRTANGSVQPMPITWYNRTAATITSSPPSIPTGSVGVDVDLNGYPHWFTMETPLFDLPQVWTELFWNGTAWAKTSNVANQPIQTHTWAGQTYMRALQGRPARISLLCRTSSKPPILLGDSCGSFTPTPDPVRLREKGIYSVLIPNGDTVDVFEWGHGPRGKTHVPVTTYTPPNTIDRTGATDVTDLLGFWWSLVPDGTETEPTQVVYPVGATYRVDGTLELTDRHDVHVTGNGTTFKVVSAGDRTRSCLRFIQCDRMWLEDVFTTGTGTGTYDSAFEAQHGFEFLACDDLTMIGCKTENVRGDQIYMGGGAYPGCNNVLIDQFFGNFSDRQGIGFTRGDGLTIRRSYICNSEHASIDLEPNVATHDITNVLIEHNIFIGGRLQWIAAAGAGEVNDITIDSNTLQSKAMGITVDNAETPQRRRSNWRVTNNISDFNAGSPPEGSDVGGRVMSFIVVDGVIVQGNEQPIQPGRDDPMYLVKARGCTGVDVSGNTVINGAGELLP